MAREFINRWPRAVARLVDLMLWIGVLIALIVFAGFSDLITQIDDPMSWVVYFLMVPVALVLDAAFSALFGNTPAKAVVGVRVTTHRGERPDIVSSFRRSYGVWTDGLGLGVLPLTLYSMFKQYRRVSGRRETNYDERLHLRVSSSPWASIRCLLLLLIVIAVPSSLFILS